MLNTKAFKAYDLRGIYPEEVNEELAYRVGKVFCALFGAEAVVVGRDIRLTGPRLVEALSNGLRDGGANVIDIGCCGTEMVYFATAYLNADGGIMITASHNPASYNGMKLVRRDARPVSGDTGLQEIEQMVRGEDFPHHLVAGKARGILAQQNIMKAYVEHLLSYVKQSELRPLRIVVNPGNGGAGAVLDELEASLPFELIKINYEPTGTFLTAFLTRCWTHAGRSPRKRCYAIKRIWVLPGTEILTDAFSATKRETLWKGIIWWASWLRNFCKNIPVVKSCMIPALSGIRKPLSNNMAVREYAVRAVMLL